MRFCELFEAKQLVDYRHPDVSDRLELYFTKNYIDPKDGFYWHYHNGILLLHSYENEVNSERAMKLLGVEPQKVSGLWNQLGGLTDYRTRTVIIDKESYGEGMAMRQRGIADVQELQKALRELRPYGVADDYTLKGAPPHIGKTVGAVLAQNDPTNQVLAGIIRTMYHGTSTKRWAIIQTQGLRPGHTPGIYNDLRAGYSEHNVYLAVTAKGAMFYGKRQAKKDNDLGYVVLKVTVPDPAKLIADDRLIFTQKLIDKHTWEPLSPAELRKSGSDQKRLAASGREGGEYAYRGIILPKHITLLRTGKI